MGSRAWVREYRGNPAVFVKDLTVDHVLMTCVGEQNVIDTTEWNALPIWTGHLAAERAHKLGDAGSGWYIEGYPPSGLKAEWHETASSIEEVERLIKEGKERDGFQVFRVRPPLDATADELNKLATLGVLSRI